MSCQADRKRGCVDRVGKDVIFSDSSSWFEVVLRKRNITGQRLPERLSETKPKQESSVSFTIDAVVDRYERAMEDVLKKASRS